MSDTVDIVMNKQYAFDVLRIDVDHGKKDWLRIAAQALAKRMLEDGCIAVHETYDIKRQGYHTCFTVLTGRAQRVLP